MRATSGTELSGCASEYGFDDGFANTLIVTVRAKTTSFEGKLAAMIVTRQKALNWEFSYAIGRLTSKSFYRLSKLS